MRLRPSEAQQPVRAAGPSKLRGGLHAPFRHEIGRRSLVGLEEHRLLQHPKPASSSARAAHAGHMTASAATTESRYNNAFFACND